MKAKLAIFKNRGMTSNVFLKLSRELVIEQGVQKLAIPGPRQRLLEVNFYNSLGFNSPLVES